MIKSIWSTLNALHFVFTISKIIMFLKTDISTSHCLCSPQKSFFLGQETFVWAKISSRVEDLEGFILNFTVYL